MNNRSKTIARVVSLVLVILMLLGTVSAGLMTLKASAAEGENTVLPRQEIYFQSKRLIEGKNYVVPKGGVLLVEKGVTLTIEGSLQVVGTLKNEGTIVVTGLLQKEDEDYWPEQYTPGSISNQGIIENAGRIELAGGTLHNYPRATLENEGTIRITNQQFEHTSLHNMARPYGDGYQSALLHNTGRIEIENEIGVGLHNYNHAVLDNTTGTIRLGEKANYRGKITGNAPQWKETTQEK